MASFWNLPVPNQRKEVVYVRAPIACPKAKDPRGFEEVDLPMLDPHAVIAYLFNEAGVEIGMHKVEAFWKHHQQVGSPFLETFDGTNQHVPLGLYGDGARARQQAYQEPEKVVGLFINLPLWRPRSARHSRFLIFAIEEHLCVGRRTMNRIYQRITWSLNHLFTGRWPSHDMLGNPINSAKAGTFLTVDQKKFALTEHRGDWSFYKWLLGFRSSWKAGTNVPVCYRCAAYGAGHPSTHYYHVGENAQVWGTIYNASEFIAREMPTSEVSVSPKFYFNHA